MLPFFPNKLPWVSVTVTSMIKQLVCINWLVCLFVLLCTVIAVRMPRPTVKLLSDPEASVPIALPQSKFCLYVYFELSKKLINRSSFTRSE